MNEEFNNLRMDPELEARIVALVLGEASELEREQLGRQNLCTRFHGSLLVLRGVASKTDFEHAASPVRPSHEAAMPVLAGQYWL